MKIDFSQSICSIDGKPMQEMQRDGDQSNLVPVTLKSVAIGALMGQHKGDENMKGDEKVSRFSLAIKIHDSAGPVDLKPEDISLIKRLIGLAWPTSVVGRAWPMLDSPDAEKQA